MNRRRRIIWAVFIAALIAGAVLRKISDGPARLPSDDPAAVFAVRGELSSARTEIQRRLATKPRDPEALFVLACIELEEGNIPAARDAARRLAQGEPEAPESLVLPLLIEEREQHPEASWTDAMLAAHKRSGPTARWVSLFPRSFQFRGQVSNEQLDALPAPERLLIEYALSHSSDRLERLALEVVTKELTVPQALVAHRVLVEAKPPRKAEADALLQRLVETDPDFAYLELSRAFEGTPKDAAFSEEEVARLETLIGDGHRWPGVDIYEAFKQAVAMVDAPAAHAAAFDATQDIAPLPSVLISRRARATAASGSPELKLRLGKSLTSFGRGLSRGGTLFEQALASLYLFLASELLGDEALRAEAKSAFLDSEAMHEKTAYFWFVSGWPIASLQRDITDRKMSDEMGILRQLME